jgi:hypothetical protein
MSAFEKLLVHVRCLSSLLDALESTSASMECGNIQFGCEQEREFLCTTVAVSVGLDNASSKQIPSGLRFHFQVAPFELLFFIVFVGAFVRRATESIEEKN